MSENGCKCGQAQFKELADKVQKQSERAIELDGKMKTLEANLESTLKGFETRMEKRDKENIQRDKENTRWIVGLFGLAIIIVLGGMGLMLSLADAF